MIERVRTEGYVRGEHLIRENLFVLDTRAHDIPNTIRGMIRALPINCIALSLRIQGGPAMIRVAEREARRREMRILWL